MHISYCSPWAPKNLICTVGSNFRELIWWMQEHYPWANTFTLCVVYVYICTMPRLTITNIQRMLSRSGQLTRLLTIDWSTDFWLTDWPAMLQWMKGSTNSIQQTFHSKPSPGTKPNQYVSDYIILQNIYMSKL